MGKSIWVVFVSVVCFWSVEAVAGDCATDNDCKGERVCHEGVCMDAEAASELDRLKVEKERLALEKEDRSKVLTPVAVPQQQEQGAEKKQIESSSKSADLFRYESGLVVEAEIDVPDAVLYIDGIKVGSLPYQGVVKPGVHIIQLKRGDTWLPKIETNIFPRRTRRIKISKSNLNNQFDTGGFHIGVVGVVMASRSNYSNEVQLPYLSYPVRENGHTNNFFGGAKFIAGFQIIKEPVWLEIGLAASLLFTKSSGYYYWDGDIDIVPVGLYVRGLLTFLKPQFYFGLEMEGGCAIFPSSYLAGNPYEFKPYFNPKISLSLFLNDWWEIRFNPAGFQYVRADSYNKMLSYTAELGIVLRI